LKARHDQLKSIRKIKEAIPDWIDEAGMAELGAQWPKELSALNVPADVVLRANTLKTTRAHLQKLLKQEDVETYAPEAYPDALILQKRKNIFSTQAFKNGLLEVQDASSQLVAPALEVEPGMRVIDACAGAGGKTLHLAALMKNRGTIIAMDTEAWKLENLKKRAARAGITIIQTRLIESSKTIKRLYDSADRLLLDVPCSGLGVLRRNPDAKWKLKPEFVENIKNTQAEILEDYSPMIHHNGKFVYSTCSILPSENSGQIEKFVQAHPFKLIREQAVLPSVSGFDGFYISLLQPR
jgi:16S rRNA (cytosine967-C5)-methyltransferase